MEKQLKERIENICIRFGHAVTELDVLEWLENFSEGDRSKALTLLSVLNYYSFNRIIGCIKDSIDKILADNPGKKPCLYPLGVSGKSGPFMAYYAKKVIDVYFEGKTKHPLARIITTENELRSLKKDKYILAYLDDFAGSGDTFDKKRKKDIEPEGITVCYLVIAYMERVEEKMKGLNVAIYGDKQVPCFAARGSVFGYEPKMRKMREFCYHYGEKLCPVLPKVDNKPLGYKNSQALVAFEHSTPNNTLPVIWYDDPSIPWKPLFPRFVNSRKDRAERYRTGKNYWLSIIYACGPAREAFLNLPKYSATAARLYALISLIRKRKSRPYMLQFLGISEGELDVLYNEGININLIDNNYQLTADGVRVFDEVNMRDKILEAHRPQCIDMLPKKVYIPHSFQGLS